MRRRENKMDKNDHPYGRRRSSFQKLLDFVTFPIRPFFLFTVDRLGMSSLATERYDYVARYVQGYCLDVGCGDNRFIREFLSGNGRGIDLFEYDGMPKECFVENLKYFDFSDESFETVTFIANINHVPEPDRDQELAEAYRVLKPGGNIIITMGNPLTEIAAHKVIHTYDRIFHTNYDMDTERGMEEDEEYYLLDSEIIGRLKNAGFVQIKKRYFLTQWGLNHLFVAYKVIG